MKATHLLIIIVAIGVVTAAVYPFLSDEDDKTFVASVIKSREDRDAFMRNSQDSPFKGTAGAFTGLKYFQPDPSYRLVADLEYVSAREPRTLSTSDGKTRSFLTYAWAAFDLGNVRHRLLILEQLENGPERGNLFLAFTDESSAGETYGGGRYLDIRKVPGASTITLDFNYAYNPFCAYNNSFSCPFPPSENHLAVLIRAGELNYK